MLSIYVKTEVVLWISNSRDFPAHLFNADLFSGYTFILNMSEVSDVFFLPQGCSY